MFVRRRRWNSLKLLLWFLFQQAQAFTLKTPLAGVNECYRDFSPTILFFAAYTPQVQSVCGTSWASCTASARPTMGPTTAEALHRAASGWPGDHSLPLSDLSPAASHRQTR